jgi:cell division protein FtsX
MDSSTAWDVPYGDDKNRNIEKRGCIVFVLRETLRYIRHSWAAWLLQALTLGVALGVSGLFVLLAWKAHDAMTALRANLAVEAFFDPALSSQDASAIADESIKSLPVVSRTIFISKEQALADYARMSGEDIEQVLGMNPLPASVKIFLADPSALSAKRLEAILRSIPHIQDVKSDLPLMAAMESRSMALDRIALVLCSLLIVSAFFQAMQSARHGFEMRRETFRTLARLGATRLTMAAPMIFFNALAGICGGLIGIGMLMLIHTQVLTAMSDTFAFTLTSREGIIAGGVLIMSGLVLSAFAAILNWSRIKL